MVSRSSTKAIDPKTLEERRVFLFEQIIIFSEEIMPKKMLSNLTNPGYIFKTSLKVSENVICSIKLVCLRSVLILLSLLS